MKLRACTAIFVISLLFMSTFGSLAFLSFANNNLNLSSSQLQSSNQISNETRMSVTTNKFTYSLHDVLNATITIQSLEANTLTGISINSSIFANNTLLQTLPSVPTFQLAAFEKTEFNVSDPINLQNTNYVIESTAIANSTEQIGSANIPLVVLSTAGKLPLTLALVFHMHQPIYMNLQSQFEQPWVQVHSGSDFEYNGTSYGAYLWHIYMLETHPNISVTFNLQPSLLYQWNYSVHNFVYNSTYTAFPGGHTAEQYDLLAINQTIASYKSLAASGRIEILTSPFYHPLSALLVQFGLSADLEAQISLGKNYTKWMMGVTPTGMWTPEMGFAMAMVPIMQSEGMQYTILDQANEFVGASGPGASQSIYQPFTLDGANGSHIIVFFRDSTLSNDMFYTFAEQPNPQVAASMFIAAIANVYRSNPDGVLTLALDGENPIVQGDELISALDYNEIYSAIESQSSWLQTSTLQNIVAHRTASAQLTYVPTNSWSQGNLSLWIGQQQKNAIWEAILNSRKILVNLTNTYGMNNQTIKKLWNDLYIAEGSDWEWQTPGGPAWFAMQGYRYAQAATTLPARGPSPPYVSIQSKTTPPKTSNYETLIIIGTVVIIALVLSSLFVLRKTRKKSIREPEHFS
jgi:Glycosyl hydrolase family 57